MNPHDIILLVEDDQIDAMTVHRALRHFEAPNPLRHVTDGERALAFLRQPENPLPGLILLDLNMPRMNGAEFLAILKADECWRFIPVIVLTTSSDEKDRRAAFQHSAAGYMIKPLEYAEFLKTMRLIYDYWVRSEAPPSAP
jgi:CheY-like chemotaxis protein